eukprot:TRINITY_DN12419_c1_g1_i1.p1 TRINITY_DN12419_c1_g1~~TRINITY_DN12419_c1_g1_i1.p1  ORF type:complete len:272 (+),score=79.90 TRINITY_DN12419_c1_g1_i1:3-818(+)
MIDPDPVKVAEFVKQHYFGLSDVVLQYQDIDVKNLTTSQKSVLVAVGLKIFYSYVATGCNIFSAFQQGNAGEGGDDDDDTSTSFGGFNTTSYEVNGHNVSMTGFEMCGCDLGCPRYTKAGGIEFDETIGALDVSLDVDIRNGLGEVFLYLPNEYLVPMAGIDDVDEDIRDGRTTAEMVYVEEDDGETTVEHCSTNVFTATPAQLNGALYECCTEKNNLEKLSQISAFAGFIMTCTILGTTILFWACGGDKDAIKEAAYGAADPGAAGDAMA